MVVTGRRRTSEMASVDWVESARTMALAKMKARRNNDQKAMKMLATCGRDPLGTERRQF